MFGMFYIRTVLSDTDLIARSHALSSSIVHAIGKNFMYSTISKQLFSAEFGIMHAKEPSSLGKTDFEFFLL